MMSTLTHANPILSSDGFIVDPGDSYKSQLFETRDPVFYYKGQIAI